MDTFNQNYDLKVMSEQDMLALSETLNLIEPGAGQETALSSLGTFPFHEMAIIAVLCILGFITVNQIFRKTRLGELVRVKLML